MPARRGTPRVSRTERAALPLRPAGALAASLLGRLGEGRPLVFVARDLQRLEPLAALLRAMAPGLGVAVYPEWDCLPFDRTSPSRGVMGARAGVLRWLTDRTSLPALVLTTAPALIQRVPPPGTWRDAHLEIRAGEPFDPDATTALLARLGYAFDERVDEPGGMALHGQTLDIFPAAAPRPCRIEHDGARVTAIRSYDPVSQRSLVEADTLVVDPATEVVLEAGSEERITPFTGQEHRLAAFYPSLVAVLDYVPDARLVVDEGVEARAKAFFERIAEGRQDSGRSDTGHDALYLGPEEWAGCLDRLLIGVASGPAGPDLAVPRFAREARPRAAFAGYVRERLAGRDRVVLSGQDPALAGLVRAAGGEARGVADWAAVAKAKPGTLLALALPVEAGFQVPEAGIVVVAAADLVGERAGIARAAKVTSPLPFGEIELRAGDAAIDRDHGLCVFEGLAPVDLAEGGIQEALRLRFAGDDTLVVPVSQADRIWRYGSEPEAVTLDKLEGGTWSRRRLEVEAAIARAARTMVGLARDREAARAEPLVPPAREMERFAAGFGFSLTPDQADAIDGALADLASGRPMDRLVCGDVGFGKTEVALRAAAAALFAGRQVAVVAPTTVLARQHVETFTRRFARFGIEVGHLSRLVSTTEAKRVKGGLADGTVRLVVGTQALGGRGVRFRDLGLTVIDEEQRFGAKMKERLRGLAGEGRFGHVLTLTATPIPRTLQTALGGLQALSVIKTPPAVRQPIRTIIGAWDDGQVRAALARERSRGGQSFVVCPRIEDIEPMERRLAALVPDLSLITAHGGLKAAEMDERMVRFADGEGDVLLATTIIESGLDVPRANAMLVWDAERFGLAQLHQLRGRVGRGQRRGAVMLLSDPEHPPSPVAEKRLRMLATYDRLGAGFAISASDLDLRGAGDLVGEQQAGHVERIGLGLYQHLLGLALRMARGEPVEDWMPEIRLGLEGAIPAEYVPEPDERLGLYMRALRLREAEEADALGAEMEDRFGPRPGPVESLLALTRLRVESLALGVERLTGGPAGTAADFRADPPELPPDADLERNNRRVVLKAGSDDPSERARLATNLLERIRSCVES